MSFRPTPPRASSKLPPSSRAWLARQYRDPYVKARMSYPVNYRSRSAFKLIDLDRRWGFLTCKDVRTVVDLGAAPGGWSQVAAGKLGWREQDWSPLQGTSSSTVALSGYGLQKDALEERADTGKRKDADWSSPESPAEMKREDAIDYTELLQDEGVPPQPAPGRGTIIAVDLLRMEPIRGVKTLQMDFLSSTAEKYISALLATEQGADVKADVILSDMASNFTGNATADVESSLAICDSVFKFAQRHLRSAENKRRRGGALVLKHFAHPEANRFRAQVLEPNFNIVVFEKPPSSRSESREGYWVCLGWKGGSPS